MLAKLVRRTSVLALLAGTAVPALSQTVVTGVVGRMDRSEPFADALVSVSGTAVGVRSGADGRYRLKVPPAVADSVDSVTVVVRAIGYAAATRRIAVRRGPVSADFRLAPVNLRLEGVVVTGGAVATDGGAPGVVKDRAASVVASDKPLAAPAPALAAKRVEMRDAREKSAGRLSTARADGARVRRGGAVNQEPAPGVLTAAVWDDAQHWPQYTRFLERASENSWNPWGLDAASHRFGRFGRRRVSARRVARSTSAFSSMRPDRWVTR